MSHIEIKDGFSITIDGKSAGSLEDALANFPTLDKELWAALHLEMVQLREKLAIAETKIPEQINDNVPSEEEQIQIEVDSRIASHLKELEIQRRISVAMARKNF